MLEDAVNRSVRDVVETFQSFVGIRCYPGGIAKQEKQKDVGIRRERRDPSQHLIEGKIVEVGNSYALSVGLSRFAKGFLPVFFERRRSNHDRDIFRRRRD